MFNCGINVLVVVSTWKMGGALMENNSDYKCGVSKRNPFEENIEQNVVVEESTTTQKKVFSFYLFFFHPPGRIWGTKISQ